MEIPKLNISVTKSAVNGQVVDVIEYDAYCKDKKAYLERSDVAIPAEFKGKDILLPMKGEYQSENTSNPGVYNAGCVDFFIYPEEAFVDRYIPKSMITMSNENDIRELISASEQSKKLDEPFITTPDNITNIPIKETDQPEMACLKMALNSKHIDIDKYASRFGDNYPNDKRQLKNDSATLNIIKRYCANCDMEAILILKDKSPDVPNPMGREISVSLTEPLDESFFLSGKYNSDSSSDDNDEEDDEY